MSELKPCPFCGGTDIRIKRDLTCGFETFSVQCTVCDAPQNYHDSERGAIAAWNRRAERTCENVHEPPKNSTFWPSPHFKCSACGCVHVSVDYVDYCPNCGAKVVDR